MNNNKTVKCPYCKTMNQISNDDIQDLNSKPYIDCIGCLDVFKIKLLNSNSNNKLIAERVNSNND